MQVISPRRATFVVSTATTYQIGLGGSLAGDVGGRVDGQAGVEDTVRYLIADLVGVSLSDGLGGEVEGGGSLFEHR